MTKEEAIEIPFGAKDSELLQWEYTIPEGMEAVIEGGKVVIRKKESEDEKIRNLLRRIVIAANNGDLQILGDNDTKKCLAYLEKQKDKQNLIEKSLDSYMTDPDGYLKDWSNAYDKGFEAAKELFIAQPEKYGLQKQKEQKLTNEDERIIQELIDYFNPDIPFKTVDIDTANKWVAWLEKQKESLHIQETCKENADSFTDDIIEVRSFQRGLEEGIKQEREKQKVNPDGDFARGYDCGYACCLNSHGAEWFEKQKEQKPASSGSSEKPNNLLCGEEDKNRLQEAIGMVEANGTWVRSDDGVKQVSDFLKSLPERFSLQPKEEWSEEDEKIMQTMIKDGDLKPSEIAWLKSLRPQPKQEDRYAEGYRQGKLEGETLGYQKGYDKGYKEANKYVSYHFPVMPTTPSGFGCDGIHCTNPHMDCINCPRKTTGGFMASPNTITTTCTHWKPSEEQMSMLRAIVNDPNNVGAESCHLAMQSLYNDLQKLL